MFTGNLTLWQGLIICLFSLVVVFIVLLVISYIIDLTAWLVRKLHRQPVKTSASVKASPVNENPPDTAWLVVAAVAACWEEESESRFVVRSIRQIAPPETAWVRASRDTSEGL